EINYHSIVDNAHPEREKLRDRINELFLATPNIGFSTYKVSQSLSVSIFETNQIVSEGTTRFRTWPAALHLMDYLLNCGSTNTDRSVIEVGAGSGLLGIGLPKNGLFRDAKYMFTDHKASLLERIP